MESEKILEFYRKHFSDKAEGVVKTIRSADFDELKNDGMTVEQVLDYLCQTYNFLLHGSIHEIKGGKLRSRYKKFLRLTNLR